jgi:hypothetical protein
MYQISTFVQRLGDILLLSLRPVQLLLAVSAFVVAISVAITYTISGPIVVDLYSYHITISVWIAVLAFSIYAGLSLYCSMVVYRAGTDSVVRYGTTVTGLVLWTMVFTLELLLNFSTLVGLRIIPIFAEGLIIAQLMSDVRSQDRRAL